jgi:DNA polymerase-3 subunit epsilon
MEIHSKVVVTDGFYVDQNYKRNKGKSLLELPDDYILLDLETSGLTSSSDIIEIAMLKIRGNKIEDKFQSLVKPNNPISNKIIEITGITNEMLVDAPEIEDVIRSAYSFIDRDIIVAHNANFDISFLYDAMNEHLNIDFSNDFVDTLRISRRVYHNLPKHSLSYLSENIPLENKNAHRALRDCIATYELYNKCKNKIIDENISLKSIRNKLKLSELRPIDESLFDDESPLYGQECVFTGALSRMIRAEAIQHVVDVGGIVGDNVTMRTNYLVTGIQDYSRFVDGKESSKTKKAKELAKKGQNINIISEDDFYRIIQIMNNSEAVMSGQKMSLIQERIAELDSGIINILDNEIEIRGFMSPERLYDYLNGIDCFYSFGVYPKDAFDESVIKDNALYIVRKNDVEISRWQYQKVFEGNVLLKINGKLLNRVIKVRKSRYDKNYQFISNEENRIFSCVEDMNQFILDSYDFKLQL